ncbi:TVP38/TMEM64 family protein [Patescibacteria group bacterium]|nr:TVP38/TMEM64 family protein [Patescibacteria group bacterium]
MRKRYAITLKFLLFIFLIALILFGIKRYNLDEYLTLEFFERVVDQYGAWSHILFLIFSIISTVTFLPASFLGVASGILFGKFLGFIYIVLGTTIGATISFVIARYLGRPFVENVLKERMHTVLKYDKKLGEEGFKTVFVLRLIPIFHFNLFNYALGLTKVSFKDYFWGTLLGSMPGAGMIVFLSHSIAANSWTEIIIGVIIGIAFFVIVFLYYRKFTREAETTSVQEEIESNKKT